MDHIQKCMVKLILFLHERKINLKKKSSNNNNFNISNIIA